MITSGLRLLVLSECMVSVQSYTLSIATAIKRKLFVTIFLSIISHKISLLQLAASANLPSEYASYSYIKCTSLEWFPV